MENPEKYLTVLAEIKRRTKVIDDIISANSRLRYRATSIEAACLQIRKVLELIAFGSLIANVRIYSAQHRKFAEHWNPKLMLKDMARVNPNFYPSPIIQKPSEVPGIDMDWIGRGPDYLTKDDFLFAYDKCGGVLHAANPYGVETDFDAYQTNLIQWRKKIINLLNAHTMTLVEDDHLYLFQMNAGEQMPTYHIFGVVK
jgi:hypothetical protein